MKRKTKRKSKLINNTGFTPGFDTENNFINYIPSEDITMRNTPYPLNATPLDQYGNPIGQTVTMQPGQDYKFGGASYVAETRMFKDGGKQDWISHKIGVLINEGYPQKQAVAIAYSMYNQKHELGGKQLPMFQNAGFTDPANPDLGLNPFENGPNNFPSATTLPSSVTNSGSQAIGTTQPVFDPNAQTAADKKLYTDAQKTPQTGITISDEELSNPTNQGNIPSSEMQKRMRLNKSVNTSYDNYDSEGNAIDTDLANQERKDFESGRKSYQFANPYEGYGIGESLTGAGLAAGQGKTGEAVLFGANAALQGAKSFLSGMGAGKRNSSLTRSMYENQRDYMSGKPQYLEEGGETELDDTDMDDMDDLTMKQRIQMLAQSYQMPEINLPQYETQQQEEMRKGGYYKFGGKSYPMYQEGDLYGEEESDLINKYPNQSMQRQEVQQRFVPQPAIYPQPQPTINEFGFPVTNSAPQLSQTAKERPKEVWEIWQEKTGTPWSAAKKAGYTDGSAKANLELANRLMRGEKLEAPKNTKPATKKAAPTKAPVKTAKDYTYQDYLDAMKNKPKLKKQQGEIRAAEDNDYLTRALEIAANPIQSFGYYSKYGEAPPQNFSRYSKNEYDRILGIANPAYWGNALLNASTYADQGDYKRAGIEALDALPAAGKLLKYIPKGAAVISEGSTGLANVGSRGVQVANKVGTAVGPARRAASLRNYFTPELAAGARNAQLGQGAVRLGQGAPRLGQGAAQTGQLSFGFGNGGYYQDGGEPQNAGFQALPDNVKAKIMNRMQEGGMQPGMEAAQEAMPQQGAADQMQQIMAQVASMLQQGASPQEVLQQLVQAGIPQEQAAQIIQAAMQQVQGASQATPQLKSGGEMIRRADGSYSRRGLWDNIRDNAGSGKAPTKEMLEQEAKIRREYQDGGEEMYTEQPQDQGNQMGQVVSQIAQALQQGANPEEILQQLIQMGVPEQEAAQMIQMVMQQMQQDQGAQQAPPQEEMQQTMKMGGKYLNMLRGKTIKSYTYNPKTDSYDIKYK